MYGQCGGKDYNGPTTCVTNLTCYVQSLEYSLCHISCQAGWLCKTTTSTTSTTTKTTTTTSTTTNTTTTTSTTTSTTTTTTTTNFTSSINISSFYNNLYFIFNTNILAHSLCHTSFNAGISGLTLFNISCTGINNAVNFTFYGNFISIK
jgi:hypothetical protein